MAVDLRKQRVLVALFVMEGCGACDEFKPRFDKISAPYAAAGIPIVVYDAQSEAPDLVAFMDRYGVTATPTMLILKRGPGSIRVDGSVDDAQIRQAFEIAHRVHRGG